MAMTLDELEAESLKISEAEREILIYRLLESLDAVDQNEVDRVWNIEIQKRLSDLKAGRAKTVPVDDVLVAAKKILNAHRTSSGR